MSPTETIPSLTKQIEEEIIKRVEDNVIGDNYIISPFSPFPDSCVFFFDPADFRMVLNNASDWPKAEAYVSEFNEIQKKKNLNKMHLQDLFREGLAPCKT